MYTTIRRSIHKDRFQTNERRVTAGLPRCPPVLPLHFFQPSPTGPSPPRRVDQGRRRPCPRRIAAEPGPCCSYRCARRRARRTCTQGRRGGGGKRSLSFNFNVNLVRHLRCGRAFSRKTLARRRDDTPRAWPQPAAGDGETIECPARNAARRCSQPYRARAGGPAEQDRTLHMSTQLVLQVLYFSLFWAHRPRLERAAPAVLATNASAARRRWRATTPPAHAAAVARIMKPTPNNKKEKRRRWGIDFVCRRDSSLAQYLVVPLGKDLMNPVGAGSSDS